MKIKDKMVEWSVMTFEKNPYGDNIPDVFLDEPGILKNGETLRKQKQNGYIISEVINDRTKESFAERTNFVLFSPIFNRLLYENKLCPSNYISEVIKSLTEYEFRHNECFDKSVYFGYISRALRSFASYIREINLKDFIVDYHKKTYTELGFSFHKEKDTYENKIKEDLYNKTDIYFEIENTPYRIWSYQSTESGIKCTLKRILKSKDGINLYIPFNIDTKKEFLGWYLYDEEKVLRNVKNSKTTDFLSFKQKIIKEPRLLKNINKVFVQEI